MLRDDSGWELKRVYTAVLRRLPSCVAPAGTIEKWRVGVSIDVHRTNGVTTHVDTGGSEAGRSSEKGGGGSHPSAACVEPLLGRGAPLSVPIQNHRQPFGCFGRFCHMLFCRFLFILCYLPFDG